MQPVIREQIEIAWPVKALFHYMSDTDTHPQWRQGVLQATWLNKIKNQSGSSLLEVRKALGKTISVKTNVTDVTVYKKQEMMVANKSFSSFYIIEYESLGNNTLLTLTVRCEAKRKINERKVMVQAAKSSFDELKQLKKVLETD